MKAPFKLWGAAAAVTCAVALVCCNGYKEDYGRNADNERIGTNAQLFSSKLLDPMPGKSFEGTFDPKATHEALASSLTDSRDLHTENWESNVYDYVVDLNLPRLNGRPKVSATNKSTKLDEQTYVLGGTQSADQFFSVLFGKKGEASRQFNFVLQYNLCGKSLQSTTEVALFIPNGDNATSGCHSTELLWISYQTPIPAVQWNQVHFDETKKELKVLKSNLSKGAYLAPAPTDVEDGFNVPAVPSKGNNPATSPGTISAPTSGENLGPDFSTGSAFDPRPSPSVSKQNSEPTNFGLNHFSR